MGQIGEIYMAAPLSRSQEEFINRIYSETKNLRITCQLCKVARNTVRRVIRGKSGEEPVAKAEILNQLENYKLKKRNSMTELRENKKQMWGDTMSNIPHLFNESRFNYFSRDVPEMYRLKLQDIMIGLKEEYCVQHVVSLNIKLEFLGEQLLMYRKYQIAINNMLKPLNNSYKDHDQKICLKTVQVLDTLAQKAQHSALKLMNELEADMRCFKIEKQTTTTIKNGIISEEKVKQKVSTME